jgi:hypothetical protein
VRIVPAVTGAVGQGRQGARLARIAASWSQVTAIEDPRCARPGSTLFTSESMHCLDVFDVSRVHFPNT